MTDHDDVTGDRTHYHGDGCTPPHPAATLAQALRVKFGPVLPSNRAAAEVLRLLASPDSCPVDLSIAAIQYALLYDENWRAAVADAVAADPEAWGWVVVHGCGHGPPHFRRSPRPPRGPSARPGLDESAVPGHGRGRWLLRRKTWMTVLAVAVLAPVRPRREATA